MRKLSGVVFEDSFCCLIRGSVKKHDRCHISPKRFGNAGYLLGQDPHADAVMACAETKIDQLARAAFHVFRSSAVIKNKKRVCFFRKSSSPDLASLRFHVVDRLSRRCVKHYSQSGRKLYF